MGRIISRKEAAQILGCDPQTITNWMDAGIIKGKRTNRLTLIDESSILALSDTLQDLAETEKRVQQRLEEQKTIDKQLKDYIHDARHTLRLAHRVGSNAYMATFLHAVTDAAHEAGLIKARQQAIVSMFIDDKPLEDIAEEFGLTRSRITQILGKATARIARLGNYGELMKENESMRQRLDTADEIIRNKDMEIAELRQKLNIATQPEEQEPQEIIEMRRLLNTPLTDFNLSVRTINCLVKDWRNRQWVEVNTLGDVVQLQKTDLLKFRNFGKKSLRELDDLLESLNLSFGMDIAPYMRKGAELEYKGYGNNS